MKRFLAIVLAVSLLCGCTASPATDGKNTQPSMAEEENPMEIDLTQQFVAAPGDALPAEKTYSFGSKDIPEYKTGDLVLVTLEVKAAAGIQKLDVHFYQSGLEGADVYFIPAQWTRLVLCSDPSAQPVGLKLAAQEGIALRSLTVENLKKVSVDAVEHRLGQFLVDDFCRAMAEDKLSPTNIWQVARFNIPGLTAHKSALAGGVPMDVLDLGDPPADWEVLSGDHL